MLGNRGFSVTAGEVRAEAAYLPTGQPAIPATERIDSVPVTAIKLVILRRGEQPRLRVIEREAGQLGDVRRRDPVVVLSYHCYNVDLVGDDA